MKIEMVAIDLVKPYPGNPRKNASAVNAVTASLREFGWQQPIVVDPQNVVVVGHTRLLAAKALGFKKVPITVMRDKTPEQIRAYRIMDNKAHEAAEWDETLLADEIAALLDADYSAELTGFDDKEIKHLLEHTGEGETKKTRTATTRSYFSVIIDVKTEAEQVELLNRLTADGYKCKALVA